jgi:hypothetical protein
MTDWSTATANLWEYGYARLGNLLDQDQCAELRSLYARPELFRSRIDMARYRFGQGEYQYFAYPLPSWVQGLRHEMYRNLAPVASRWMSALSLPFEYPEDLDSFLRHCHENGQQRPTPLLLKYRVGDYNRLHQDLYGPVVFPFQVITCLSQPDAEFAGGELILMEQQPRAQSIGNAIRLQQGESVVISTRYRQRGQRILPRKHPAWR